MRRLLVAWLISVSLTGCVTGSGGAGVASPGAASPVASTALALACGRAEPILAKWAATKYPRAAPYINGAQAAFSNYCAGALPAGTRTTVAVATVNTVFAILLGSGLMDQ